jgi:hypothetical protein
MPKWWHIALILAIGYFAGIMWPSFGQSIKAKIGM